MLHGGSGLCCAPAAPGPGKQQQGKTGSLDLSPTLSLCPLCHPFAQGGRRGLDAQEAGRWAPRSQPALAAPRTPIWGEMLKEEKLAIISVPVGQLPLRCCYSPVQS